MTTLIPDKLFFKIGEVADLASVEQHVLRYWEDEIDALKPTKNKSGQRLYQKKDVELVLEIKRLLYEEKFTIAGAKSKLKRFKKKVTQLLRSLKTENRCLYCWLIKKPPGIKPGGFLLKAILFLGKSFFCNI